MRTALIRPFLVSLLLLVPTLGAEPFSTARRIDFFREVASRNLVGLAARSDGRLINAATVSRLPGTIEADLLWSLAADEQKIYVGTGPDGKLFSLAADSRDANAAILEAELPDSHILALAAVPTGGVLAGTSPKAFLAWVRDGEIVAQTRLPAGSILDILVYADDETGKLLALVATGAPGRIYRVDLEQFSSAGLAAGDSVTVETLADQGITPWAVVRDDNIRTLLRLADGRVIAGSAPKGNIYQFAPVGGAPRVLAENRNAEVTDLLAWDDGFFAAITQTNELREARVNRPKAANPPAAANNESNDAQTAGEIPPPAPPPAAPVEKFRGRAQLIWFPDDGFPETVVNRNNTAFYQLQRHQNWLLITGGEEGELLGYDPIKRLNLTFAGAVAAQVNAIQPLPNSAAFLLVGNNPAGLELLDFTPDGMRTARTDTIDLGVPADFGALRFDHTILPQDTALTVEMRASYGSDELEGWTDWITATGQDDGWTAPDLRGRYFQIRLAAKSPQFEVPAATLYTLPQNQRPRLQNFRVLAPNFALIPAPERAERASTTLGQVLQGGKNSGARDSFMSSEVVPQPGTQVVLWDVDDPDSDSLVGTFSIKGPDETAWTDLVVASPAGYAQFEISHLPEGVYRTRLQITETTPRLPDQRLTVTFETDDFLIDRTPPQILSATVERNGNVVAARIRARDQLSLLRGAEFNLNSGANYAVENPVDGILDGREESFTIELTPVELGGATSVEIVILDQNGNSAARRLALPPR